MQRLNQKQWKAEYNRHEKNDLCTFNYNSCLFLSSFPPYLTSKKVHVRDSLDLKKDEEFSIIVEMHYNPAPKTEEILGPPHFFKEEESIQSKSK